jgi:hypothetical protein
MTLGGGVFLFFPNLWSFKRMDTQDPSVTAPEIVFLEPTSDQKNQIEKLMEEREKLGETLRAQQTRITALALTLQSFGFTGQTLNAPKTPTDEELITRARKVRDFILGEERGSATITIIGGGAKDAGGK